MSLRAPSDFWNWSLEVYDRPEASRAALALQDAHGCNVNMLLFCCWTVHTGYRPIGPAMMARANTVAKAWSRMVTGPLRKVRRALKEPPPRVEPGAAEALRAQVMEAELDAEAIEQKLLQDLAAELPVAQPSKGARARHLALTNLCDYAAVLGLAEEIDRSNEDLAALVEAAFPD